jgi:hypothetical protein
MNMIGHQTIGKDLCPAAAAGVREQAAILRIVLVLEKGPLPSIAPLCHMVGQAGHNYSWKSCHAAVQPPP